MLLCALLLFINLCNGVVFPAVPSGPLIQISVTESDLSTRWLYTNGLPREILTTTTNDISLATNFTFDLSSNSIYYPIGSSYPTGWGVIAIQPSNTGDLQQYKLISSSDAYRYAPLVCTGTGSSFSCIPYNAPVQDTIATCAARNYLIAYNDAYYNHSGPVALCGPSYSPTVVSWLDVRHYNQSSSSSSLSSSSSPTTARSSGTTTLPKPTTSSIQQQTSSVVTSLVQPPTSVFVNPLASATSSPISSASCSVTVMLYYTTTTIRVPVGSVPTDGGGSVASGTTSGTDGSHQYGCTPVTSTIVA